ncbi:hypothetical protein DXG01_015224, partial [Tephrocybe rancida]
IDCLTVPTNDVRRALKLSPHASRQHAQIQESRRRVLRITDARKVLVEGFPTVPSVTARKGIFTLRLSPTKPDFLGSPHQGLLESTQHHCTKQLFSYFAQSRRNRIRWEALVEGLLRVPSIAALLNFFHIYLNSYETRFVGKPSLRASGGYPASPRTTFFA